MGEEVMEFDIWRENIRTIKHSFLFFFTFRCFKEEKDTETKSLKIPWECPFFRKPVWESYKGNFREESLQQRERATFSTSRKGL